MFESFVAWILNNYIGEYLENLNTDQLSVAVLQGQLVLENVPIKRRALRRFNLPLYISSGIVGRLTVSIPITRLHTEPWVISISDVSVVIEPSHLEYDVEFDEQYAQFKKKEQMSALEIVHRKKIFHSFAYDVSDNSWWNYGTSLALRIMENVHLVASNISVVYRDRSTAAGQPFTLGITISQLTMQNSDKNWVRGYTARRPDENMFKIVDLAGFSVHWDVGYSDDENIVTALAQLVFGQEPTVDHEYVLHPLAMTVRIQKRCVKLPPSDSPPVPKYLVAISSDDVSLNIRKWQVYEAWRVLEDWQYYKRAARYRKWRPNVPVKNNASKWWKFAASHCCDDWKMKRTHLRPVYLATRAHHFTAYCKAYGQKLLNKGFTKSDEALMRQIEHEYSLDDLYLFREVAVEYLVKPFVPDEHSSSSPTAIVVSPAAQQQGWLRSWIDWFMATGTYDSCEVPVNAEGSGGGGQEQSQRSAGTAESEATVENRVLSSAEKSQLEKMLAENVTDIMDEISSCSSSDQAEVFAEVHASISRLALSTCDDSIYPETSPSDKSNRQVSVSKKRRSIVGDTSVEATAKLVFQPAESSDAFSPKYDVRLNFDKQVTVDLDQREYLSLKRLLFGHEDVHAMVDRLDAREVSAELLHPPAESQILFSVDMTAVCLNLRTLFAGVDDQQIFAKLLCDRPCLMLDWSKSRPTCFKASFSVFLSFNFHTLPYCAYG